MTRAREVEMRARLAELAKSLKLTMPQAQLLLSQERFLARLSSIDTGRAFVWKGGSLILRMYRTLPIPRYTVDIDLLLKGMPMASVRETFERALLVDLDDGFRFDGVTSEPMERETPYGGDRLEVGWTFFRKQASQALRVDVCAGDIVNEQEVALRNLFLMQSDEQSLAFKVYPPEFIFAEKLETAVRFGTGNSRFKDFVDMWSLIRIDTDRTLVSSAIRECFANRSTTCSTSDIRSILEDQEFVAAMSLACRRNFSQLGLPDAKDIFADLLTYIEGLQLGV